MFQYAAGRSLAHHLNTKLKLDISEFKHYSDRFYALRHFNTLEEFASPRETSQFWEKHQTKYQQLVHRAKRYSALVLKRIKFQSFLSEQSSFVNFSYVYSEPHFHFDQNFFNVMGNIYLAGYWQSEKYLKDIEDIIRKEFTVKEPISGKNLELEELIKSCQSVSLHVRRGDYVDDPKINKVHGICSLEYYQTAIQKMIEYMPMSHFFVFSDDPEWAKNNLQVPHPIIFVDHNGPEAAYEDLRLITLCQNHIIANSSFSWWGAWLCLNINKIVIAPTKWFGEEVIKNRYLGDLYPEGWHRL